MVTTVAQIDPVCGMTVDPEHAAGSVEYEGKTYYFCSTHCVHKFRENPEAFLNKPAVQPIGITRQAPAKPKPESFVPDRNSKRTNRGEYLTVR